MNFPNLPLLPTETDLAKIAYMQHVIAKTLILYGDKIDPGLYRQLKGCLEDV